MFSHVSIPIHMSLGLLYVLLGEVSVQVLCSFFNWVVCLPGVESCEFFMNFWDQTFVWGIIDEHIFPYGWFPFHFADFFLAMQKLFNLLKSHLFILSFMSLALGDILVKIWCGIFEICPAYFTFLPTYFRGNLYLSIHF